MNNNEIFDEFWQNFEWPEPEALYFRLYYDDQGKPIRYSRIAQDGKFIEITPEEFAIGDMNVDVINNVLVHRAPPPPPKLRPSAQGTCCHNKDVSVVVDGDINAIKWNYE